MSQYSLGCVHPLPLELADLPLHVFEPLAGCQKGLGRAGAQLRAQMPLLDDEEIDVGDGWPKVAVDEVVGDEVGRLGHVVHPQLVADSSATVPFSSSASLLTKM